MFSSGLPVLVSLEETEQDFCNFNSNIPCQPVDWRQAASPAPARVSRDLSERTSSQGQIGSTVARSERAGSAAITSSETDTVVRTTTNTRTVATLRHTIMPLFGKAKPKEKPKEEVGKVNRTPTVEDKYDMKDVLGT